MGAAVTAGGGSGVCGGGDGGRRGAAASLLLLVAVLWAARAEHAQAVSPATADTHYGEYCQLEIFQARCRRDQVVFIQSALYGRMRVGRCVITNYGNVGCQADVTQQTDRHCSGRHQCQVRIPDATFENTRPCPIEFKTYFEVSYECLPVVAPENHNCLTHNIIPLTSPSGYLASIIAEGRGYGALSCPWKISLPHGQRVNITLFDFSTPDSERKKSSAKIGGKICYQYAIITERMSVTRNVRICGGSTREWPVYVSRTNSVEVRLITNQNVKNGRDYNFLLKYEAIGCIEVKSPEYGYISMEGDDAIVTCNFTALSWRLKCAGTQWVGQSFNCTPPIIQPDAHYVTWGGITIPYELSIGIIIGLAVIVGVIILLVGLICIEWKKMAHARRVKRQAFEALRQQGEQRVAAGGGGGGKEDGEGTRTATYVPAPGLNNIGGLTALPDVTKTPDKSPNKNNDYSYVREMWPMAPPPLDGINGQNLDMNEPQSVSGPNTPSSCHYGYSPDCALEADFADDDHHIYECPRTINSDDVLAPTYFELEGQQSQAKKRGNGTLVRK